ncbi:hypothetical protein AAC387_Pa06g1919 [Persea americana]
MATPNIWCISNSSNHLATSFLDASSQHLTILLSNPISGLSTLVTGVYGSTNPTQRKNLWQALSNASTTTLPWCVLGDFNAILAHDEKLSLRQATPSSLKDFQVAVMQAGLSDLFYSGSKFTWSNNRQGLSYLAARLDIALVNSLWLACYPDPSILHLPRLSLDHSPILLNHSNPHPAPNAPFKFENKWLLHPSLLEVVSSSWESTTAGNPQFILAHKLKALKQALKIWIKHTFGQIHNNIHLAEANVLCCQQSFDSSPSDTFWNDLMAAKLGLHDALKAQEIHWKQRSRISWLKEGDKNTKFFHQSAKAKSSFNSIKHISVDGLKVDDPLIIQGQAVDYFSNLFKPHEGQLHHILFQIDRPKVSELDNFTLIYMPLNSEIKEAVFALKRNSSPGPDGFNGAFYTSAWGIIG